MDSAQTLVARSLRARELAIGTLLALLIRYWAVVRHLALLAPTGGLTRGALALGIAIGHHCWTRLPRDAKAARIPTGEPFARVAGCVNALPIDTVPVHVIDLRAVRVY
ncbi:MAG: hypothetical protein RMJ98_16280 [Myxococcales bacterium]|nr:hypothetical protein [Myxococcales bacterium]